PRKVIEDIIAFVERERELFGDFSIDTGSDQQKEENPSEESGSSDSKRNHKNSTEENTPSYSPAGRQTASGSAAIESQENMFEQDPSRKIYYEIGKCQTLEELEKLCRGADLLHTDLENTNLVFGVGNPDADLVLIGEAPGAEEDRQGEPFVGAAGKLLNKILDAINFSREDVYIANILKHRPPNNRNPLPEERQRSLPFLLRQIDLIDPKLILCLGKVSAQTLLESNESLGSMREEFHTFRGKYELLVTYHPAALLRNPHWKRPTWEDMKMLRNRYDELGCTP
ncbi:MAG: uracil-DNA glycosylase, partial [Balneolaceae bacterium]|nr:uracil-DNA glycosylase [Balneolaceae bacterium]